MLLGGMLLTFRWQQQLVLLIHVNYLNLATVTGVLLLSLGSYQFLRPRQTAASNTGHVSIFTPHLGAILLLSTALLGLWVNPKPLSGQTALNRGVSQHLSVTRDQPQAFRPQVNPEERTLLDWIRTLEVFPDPYTYEHQPVNVDGFVVHPEDAPAKTFLLARFLISCCAADAYPVALPTRWTDSESLEADRWYRVQGRMAVQAGQEQPQILIQAEQVIPIPTPVNPYAN
ncbi:MAG: TIGR03943 family protein [Synechococcaceae cyanobacterium SM2_3_1]|nr:TIGR03943 family protein [Synechococcaceae cyanobacterium SM2_3_1]